ncbi:MAG: hypothetical protein ACYSWP_22765 [Planctomycetota bacterium]|jgi:hypothetical protein
MFEEIGKNVVERWKKAFGEYEILVANAEREIVRYKWADGERYNPLPLYFLRFPGRARALKRPPESKTNYTEYGLDDDGVPRLCRHYDYMGRDLTTFYVYNDGQCEIIGYSRPPRVPVRVEQILFENSRVSRHVRFQLNGHPMVNSEEDMDPNKIWESRRSSGSFKILEDYVYERDRLTEIHICVDAAGKEPSNRQEHFSYDEAGKLAQIERFHKGGLRQIVYRRREKGQTFKSIRQNSVEKMVRVIIDKLRNENIREKLYCIALSYRAITNYFPPLIIAAPESYRNELLGSNNKDELCCMFIPVLQNPEEHWHRITDPEMLEACRQLEQEIKMKSKWDTATEILQEVACTLSHYDWTGILNVTPDFVVFAIDFEADDLTNALRQSASEEQINKWKREGWL